MSCTCDDEIQRLIELANAAALDRRKWGWFLQRLSEAVGNIRVQIFSQDHEAHSVLGHITHGYDPRYLDSLDAYYGRINPWGPGVARLPVGRAVPNRAALADEDLLRTEFYGDWLRPQDDIIAGAGAVLERGTSRLTVLSGNIPRRDRDRLEPRLVSLLDRLLPALQHALAVSRTLGLLSLENRVLRDSLDPDIAAVFALDRRGRVHYANARGEQLCEEGRSVRLAPFAKLCLTDAEAQSALARALHDQLLPEFRFSPPFFLPGSARTQFLCHTTPLGPDDGPLPWIAPASGLRSDFLLLILSPIARPTRSVPRQPTIG